MPGVWGIIIMMRFLSYWKFTISTWHVIASAITITYTVICHFICLSLTKDISRVLIQDYSQKFLLHICVYSSLTSKSSGGYCFKDGSICPTQKLTIVLYSTIALDPLRARCSIEILKCIYNSCHSPQWHDTGIWSPYSCNTRTYLSYRVSIMSVDAPAKQGALGSATD